MEDKEKKGKGKTREGGGGAEEDLRLGEKTTAIHFLFLST